MRVPMARVARSARRWVRRLIDRCAHGARRTAAPVGVPAPPRSGRPCPPASARYRGRRRDLHSAASPKSSQQGSSGTGAPSRARVAASSDGSPPPVASTSGTQLRRLRPEGFQRDRLGHDRRGQLLRGLQRAVDNQQRDIRRCQHCSRSAASSARPREGQPDRRHGQVLQGTIGRQVPERGVADSVGMRRTRRAIPSASPISRGRGRSAAMCQP